MAVGCAVCRGGIRLATCWNNTVVRGPRWLATAAWVLMVAAGTCRACLADDELFANSDTYLDHPNADSLWEGWADKGNLFFSEPPGPLAFSFDYRVQAMFNSFTSYQFGTPPMPGQYAPLSKLDWCLNTTWHGLRLGLDKEDSAVHFQWLTPIGRNVNGKIDDFDWSAPDTAPASLSSSPERWIDGQMLEFEYDLRLFKRPVGLPVEVWPIVGFRWQRFDMVSFEGDQLINDGTLGPSVPPVGYHWPDVEGTFKQEYSIGYLGLQLRGRLETGILPPIALTLQGDWGYTHAENIDHHISGYEDAGIHRYTMDNTHGDAMHFSLTAESLFCHDRFSIGVLAEYLDINTTGTHRWVETGNTTPVDMSWSNGVSVSSRQTAITAFFRLRI
jgi:hypothetical protein